MCQIILVNCRCVSSFHDRHYGYHLNDAKQNLLPWPDATHQHHTEMHFSFCYLSYRGYHDDDSVDLMHILVNPARRFAKMYVYCRNASNATIISITSYEQNQSDLHPSFLCETNVSSPPPRVYVTAKLSVDDVGDHDDLDNDIAFL